MYQTDPPHPVNDTKSEDSQESGLPDEFHIIQPQLLGETFNPPNYPINQIFTGGNLNIYYDPRHPQRYKRTDWFAAVDTASFYPNDELRWQYIVWQEGVNPFVVIELLSPGTEKEDLGETLPSTEQPPAKWQVYERILRVPYYIVFDYYRDVLRAFILQADRYTELNLEETRIWMPTLELGLGLWQGTYQGIERLWLRWYDAYGNWTELGSRE
jgi:Uma2 family endonuclease